MPQPKAPDPRIGTTLGKYTIIGVLGRGGMGVVYRGAHILLDREVAIKLLPEGSAEEPTARERFFREARVASRLSHPNVVAVHDVDEHNGTCFLVMELVRGMSAADFLRQRGRFPWAEATRIAADACRGLQAAHEAGLIHRDVKPANILRSEAGVVKLADFGLAKVAGHSHRSITGAGAVLGTPQFMSPEQAHGDPLDARSDLYSLGATYFALLTGRPPFVADEPLTVMYLHVHRPTPNPCELLPELPVGVGSVVLKAMAKSPELRYQSAAEMLADMVALQAGQPTSLTGSEWTRIAHRGSDAPTARTELARTALPTQTAELPVRRLGSRRLWLAAVVAGLVLLAAGVGLWPSQTATVKPPQDSPKPDTVGTVSSPKEPPASAVGGFQQLPVTLSGPVWGVRFSPSGRVLVLACTGGGVYLVPLDGPPHVPQRLEGFIGGAEVRALAVGRGRDSSSWRIAAGTLAGELAVWEVPAGGAPRRISGPVPAHSGILNSLAFSPDGSRLVSVGWIDNHIRLWNPVDLGSRSLSRDVGSGLTYVTFDADGTLLTSSDDGKVRSFRLSDLEDDRELRLPSLPDRSSGVAECLAVTGGASGLLLAGCRDSSVRGWTWPAGEAQLPLLGHKNWVFSAAVSPDGRLLATGSADPFRPSRSGEAILWRLPAGERIGTLLESRDSGVSGVAFSPDGRRLAVVTFAGVVRVCDVLPARP